MNDIELHKELATDFTHAMHRPAKPCADHSVAGRRKTIDLTRRAIADTFFSPDHECAGLEVADVGVEEALFDGAGFGKVFGEVAGEVVAVHWLESEEGKEGVFAGEKVAGGHSE